MNASMITKSSVATAVLACLLAAVAPRPALAAAPAAALEWPAPTAQNRPWTRWWWLGSAVDKANLTHQLTRFDQAGIGGVEICPIYGAKGFESAYLDFLSPAWMDMLNHTITQAARLDMGVDLTTGTGWPFGGPVITAETASAGLVLKQFEWTPEALARSLPAGTVQWVVARSDDGRRIDLTDQARQDRPDWTAPPGHWTVYAAAMKSPIQKVKRAAPGGAGYVVDPYSITALDAYLAVFDAAFAATPTPKPRAQFHDSFEYFGATWTADFLDAFKDRRGYDLADHLEALFGVGPEETVARILCDYHETINDLHLAYLRHWTKWCHAGGSLARNQAHGAPANLIDLYAAADIPETEIFGTVDDTQFPMLKLSASAAHLNGTALVASESFTWLRDHFQTTLADLKHATDFLFVSGINHLFFHGVPYSPREAAWPGWQFYAAVNFGPDGGLWHDLPAYTAYVTRCQSILQSGRPDNDVLLYLPMYDFWQKTEPLHMTFTVHNQDDWLTPSSFYHAAMMLRRQGYTFDAVSDRFLGAASCRDGQVFMHETPYRAVVVPRCRLIPPQTLQALLRLADAGATVLFEDQLPVDVPGLARLDDRRAALKTLLAKARPACGTATENSQSAGAFGRGTLRVGDLAALLAQTPIAREAAATAGLAFERRRRSDGFDYFLVNRTETAFDGWLPLGRPAQSAVLMDPLYDNRTGWAALQTDAGKSAVYLQLPPGQSVILRTFSNQPAGTPAWAYTRPAGETRSVDGVWTVAFIDGGPVLPEGFQTSRLASWTHRDDPEAARFFGTARYTITLDMGAETADDWRLELGRVCESARLTLNGVDLGTLWAEPFQRHLGRHLTVGKNTLQIDVTNRAANRIRDLDRRQVNWKYFHDANVVNIDYKPFDAADWPLAESGLIGPVRLTPLKTMHPEAPQPAPTAKD